MSDLLELIRKTQPLYNHLPPAEAKILDELVTAAHDMREHLVTARKLLAPFGSAADGLVDSLPDSYMIVLKTDAATPFAMITTGELRRARAALTDEPNY